MSPLIQDCRSNTFEAICDTSWKYLTKTVNTSVFTRFSISVLYDLVFDPRWPITDIIQTTFLTNFQDIWIEPKAITVWKFRGLNPKSNLTCILCFICAQKFFPCTPSRVIICDHRSCVQQFYVAKLSQILPN